MKTIKIDGFTIAYTLDYEGFPRIQRIEEEPELDDLQFYQLEQKILQSLLIKAA